MLAPPAPLCPMECEAYPSGVALEDGTGVKFFRRKTS